MYLSELFSLKVNVFTSGGDSNSPLSGDSYLKEFFSHFTGASCMNSFC